MAFLFSGLTSTMNTVDRNRVVRSRRQSYCAILRLRMEPPSPSSSVVLHISPGTPGDRKNDDANALNAC